MPEVLAGPALTFRFRAVDIRDLDGGPLLESGNPDENVIAVLMRLGDKREAVRRTLHRISENEPGHREIALREFITLAGLRHLGTIVEQETEDSADSGRHSC